MAQPPGEGQKGKGDRRFPLRAPPQGEPPLSPKVPEGVLHRPGGANGEASLIFWLKSAQFINTRVFSEQLRTDCLRLGPPKNTSVPVFGSTRQTFLVCFRKTEDVQGSYLVLSDRNGRSRRHHLIDLAETLRTHRSRGLELN